METYLFENQESFRQWLEINARSHPGIWLIFGKIHGPKTLTPDEALHEALCFGWIDGQIKKMDAYHYIKYFAERRSQSVWSERNKGLVSMLESRGKMTDLGREKIELAKIHGQWENPLEPLTETHVMELFNVLEPYELALSNLKHMSNSIQKTYAGYYLSAKQETTRSKRLASIVHRLNQNLKPM